MKVKEMMTKNPAVATPDMTLSKIARMMADEDVGAIPVVDNKDNQKVVGVITDRDITVRAVALEKNPLMMKASEIMSTGVVTVTVDDDVKDVARLMEKNQVRRVPVLDEMGKVCGIVAQADIALHASDRTTANVVEEISKPDKPKK
jgi:CBS domain-containing protein